MGDMGDFFNDLRRDRQEKRHEKAAKAPQIIAGLTALGHTVAFINGNGPHLRIDARFDYWVSTDLLRLVGGAKANKRSAGYRKVRENLRAVLEPPEAPQEAIVRVSDQELAAGGSLLDDGEVRAILAPFVQEGALA